MSFITPIFLVGAAAAALPVIFHFVRKMRAKKVPFGSLMFLQATPKEVVKRRRLRDVLLMALRVAMLLLLAFAFARPFIPQEQIPFIAQRENRSVVFLLDGSLSMQVAGRFDRARLIDVTWDGPRIWSSRRWNNTASRSMSSGVSVCPACTCSGKRCGTYTVLCRWAISSSGLAGRSFFCRLFHLSSCFSFS